jgi:hypothetical protein
MREETKAIPEHKRVNQRKTHNVAYVIGTSKALALKHLNKPENFIFFIFDVWCHHWHLTTKNHITLIFDNPNNEQITECSAICGEN